MQTNHLIVAFVVAFVALALAVALSSCQGLTLSLHPDGSVRASYSPPPKAVVVPAK
jgi:hypothetical protein